MGVKREGNGFSLYTFRLFTSPFTFPQFRAFHNHPESRVPSPESRVPSPESRVPSPEPRVPSPESRVPSPESRVPSPESRVPSPESRVPSPESRVPSPESRVPSPESRVPTSLLPIHFRIRAANVVGVQLRRDLGRIPLPISLRDFGDGIEQHTVNLFPRD